MILRLRSVFECPGKKQDFDYDILPESLDYLTDKTFCSPINVSGAAENHAGVVLLKVCCRFAMQHECDMCLSKFEREYVKDFEHTLVLKSYTDDDELVVCEHSELDLDELVIGDILLSLPTKILCREDCKGLCLTCGKNLNEGDCGCDN